MGEGFSNPLTGVDGALVRKWVKSPNFLTTVQGWIVRKDGTAEFQDVVIRGTIVLFPAGALGDPGTLQWDDGNPEPPGIGELLNHFLSIRGSSTQATGAFTILISENTDPTGNAFASLSPGQHPILAALVHNPFLGNNALQLTQDATNNRYMVTDQGTMAAQRADLAEDGLRVYDNTGTRRTRVGLDRFRFGPGPEGGYYYEEVTLDPQVVPSAAAPSTQLTAMSASHLATDYGGSQFAAGMWTCPVSGPYTVTFDGAFLAWVAGSRLIVTLQVNGTNIVRPDLATNNGQWNISDTRWYTAGDTLKFFVAQVTGVNQTVGATGPADPRSLISIRRHL